MEYACRIRPAAGCLRKGGRMRLNREALGGMLRNGSKVGVRGVPAEIRHSTRIKRDQQF